MIISRTPYRISFFGGGTDYHTWYQEHGGAVLSTTINHYCYLTCRFLPPFFNHKSRIVWTKTEEVMEHEEIQHPAVKAVLQYLDVKRGIEIHHQGGLPARSGLGSSSSFTVGLLNAVYAMRGVMSSKHDLACEAVHIEREVLKEGVGIQDQISAAYGGFNKITIARDGNFEVDPVTIPSERLAELQDHLLLFFTGVSRSSSQIAQEQMKAIPKKTNELNRIREMVDEGLKILEPGGDLADFGKLLHEGWMLKRSISKNVSPDFVDYIYKRAMDAGALGGKLLGAGGGGFMLFFAKPEDHPRIMEALSDLLIVPFEFETGGSKIIFYEEQKYSRSSLMRRDFMHLQDVDKYMSEKIAKDRISKINVI